MAVTSLQIKELAQECGFELAGIAAAAPHSDFERFERWRALGYAGEMGYLTDYRGDLRADPRTLLPSAKSIVCLGKLYNTGTPEPDDRSGISRYAWGTDYHDLMRGSAKKLLGMIEGAHGEPIESKICVDTAPLLERSYAKEAGLGWIGKNTCLINQQSGSWFFLAEILLSVELMEDSTVPDRCGTCTRCIDACPTAAFVPDSGGGWIVDSRRCISYLTIEKRTGFEADEADWVGTHVFGCDICQDVCPWNRRAPVTEEIGFERGDFGFELADLAEMTEAEFREQFRGSPVWRSKYEGFLRNVCAALGNAGTEQAVGVLEALTRHSSATVQGAAEAALNRLRVKA